MTPCRLNILWAAGHSVVYIAQRLQIPVGEVCVRLTRDGHISRKAYPLCRKIARIPARIVMQPKPC
jgi:hypothetical protein